MISSDLFAKPPPRLSMEEASNIIEQFGVRGRLSTLGSERDQNIRVEVPDGPGFVLKITNPAEPRAVIDFETRILEHLAHTAPQLPVPRLKRTLDGAVAPRWLTEAGARTVRLLTFLPGIPLANAAYTPMLRSSIGTTLAALNAALRSVAGPLPRRPMMWDFANVTELRRLLPSVADRKLRGRLEGILDRLELANIPIRPDLRAQWLHNDFNPSNLLVSASDMSRVQGIIDFGDMVYGPLVCDLAVACAYALDVSHALGSIGAIVAGFDRHTPLREAEMVLLPQLIEARFAMTVLIAGWRATLDPDNRAYILRNYPGALAGLEALGETRASDMALQLRRRVLEQRRNP